MEETIKILIDYISVLVALASVGYALQYLGRKLYFDVKNNVNGCEKAHKRAFYFGCFVIIIIISGCLLVGLYLNIDRYLLLSMLCFITAFLSCGYIFNSDFKDISDE